MHYLELCKLLKMLILVNMTTKDMTYVLMKEVSLVIQQLTVVLLILQTLETFLIFGADMSFSIHATSRANKFYVTGDLFIQGINDTTIYAEKKFYRNFTEPGKKFKLSLHYNGGDSYLFVNGRQELKFKCKTDQLVKEKSCIGNLIDQWTTSESEKTGLYGNIYDFVVDYEQIFGVKAIYDMHRYLMTKHNIGP